MCRSKLSLSLHWFEIGVQFYASTVLPIEEDTNTHRASHP